MKEGSGPVNPPTHPPWVVLASYHIASTTACPGIAPCPVPDHIRALSRAGSLSSTHLLFGGLFPFFFPPLLFLLWTVVSSRQTVTSPVKSVAPPNAHRVSDVTVHDPLSLPPACWSFRYPTISQRQTRSTQWQRKSFSLNKLKGKKYSTCFVCGARLKASNQSNSSRANQPSRESNDNSLPRFVYSVYWWANRDGDYLNSDYD